MHEVEYLGNHLKLEGTISLQKCNVMNTQRENPFQAAAQFIPLYY